VIAREVEKAPKRKALAELQDADLAHVGIAPIGALAEGALRRVRLDVTEPGAQALGERVIFDCHVGTSASFYQVAG
jgi:hypothetical protein